MRNLFKIGTSLVLAVIAALVVFLAALIGGARIGTVFLRTFVAFLTAGVLAWLVLFLLEAKGIAAFDRELTPPEGEDAAEAPPADGEAEAPEAPGESQGKEAAESAEAPAEQASFQPLAADGLKHVEPVPEGSQATE